MTSYFHVRCCLNCAIRSIAEGRRNSTQHHPSQAQIFSIPTGYRSRGIVDTELRQTHLNALERATIVKTINTAKTLGGPV